MKTFVLLENIYFVWRNTPRKTLLKNGSNMIKIDAKLCSVARSAFVPPSKQNSQNQVHYEKLQAAIREKLQPCTYFNLMFTVLEFYSCQKKQMEYQLKMEFYESLSQRDWLKILKEICGIGDGIKIKLILRLGQRIWKGNDVELVTKGMPIHDYDESCLQETTILDSTLSFCLDTTFGKNDFQRLLELGERPVGQFTILLDIDDDAVVFANKTVTLKEMNQKILDETFTDVVIAAGENQIEINCHQCFLSVCSPVFRAMLQTPMREGLTKRIEISDVSEHSVRMLIQYMYTSDVSTENIGIMVELLKLAHKYDVVGLEQILKNKLNKMPKLSYSVDEAMTLFCFVKNFDDDGSQKLKRKTVEVLQSYKVKFKTRRDHGQPFDDDQSDASGFYEYMLKAKF